MIEISKQQVVRVANLAKIAISDDEIVFFGDALRGTLSWITKLSEINTDAVDVCINPLDDLNISNMRNDDSLLPCSKDDVLFNAPVVQDGCFSTPRIVDTKDE